MEVSLPTILIHRNYVDIVHGTYRAGTAPGIPLPDNRPLQETKDELRNASGRSCDGASWFIPKIVTCAVTYGVAERLRSGSTSTIDAILDGIPSLACSWTD